MLATDQIIERQAPSNNSQAWEDDNFTGLYTASNSTFLAAYWHQNIANASEELVVYSRKQISPMALLKVAIPATAQRAIHGLLKTSHSHSLMGRRSPCLL